MTQNRQIALTLALSFLALYVVAGCSPILETLPYDQTLGINEQQCRAGAYFLPRRLLSFQLAAPDDKNGGRNDLTFDPNAKDGLIAVADPRLPLCIDYLSAPTADDVVTIGRTPDGLLTKISANAQDKSLEIASAVIDAVRISVVGAARSNVALKSGNTALAAKFDMDPFDVPEAAAINNSLKDFGYCIFVEGYTFDPSRFNARSYCRNPRAAVFGISSRMPAIDREAALSESRRGVLYRPNLPYRVVVMRNLDPNGSGTWQPWQSYAVEMPNASPVFSIGVDRTYFTDRSTLLTFDYGVLKDVKLTKGSELNSIAEIPLRVAQAVTTIPTQVVQLRINRTNGEEALIAAQGQLLATYRDFQDQQKQLHDVTSALSAGQLDCIQRFPNDQIARENCLNQLGPNN
jgi:hypothetical protein